MSTRKSQKHRHRPAMIRFATSRPPRGIFALALALMLLIARFVSAQSCLGGICVPPVYHPPGHVVPSQAISPQPPEAVRRAARAVVMISNRGFGGGSGVYLGNRFVLSCDHLFRDSATGRAQIGRVIVSAGNGQASAARVIVQDPIWDLALLRLEHTPRDIPPIPLSRTIPRRGELAVSCGWGGRGEVRFNVGHVRGFALDKYQRGGGASDTIILTGNARGGDSGGPIFNAQGELAGVLWGSNSTTVVGTVASRCRIFAGRWISPPCQPAAKQPTQPPLIQVPGVPSNPPSSSEPPRESLLGDLAQLRRELAQLRIELAALKRQPGPPVPPGPKGDPGRNSPAVKLDRLVSEVKRRLAGSIRVKVEPIKTEE